MLPESLADLNAVLPSQRESGPTMGISICVSNIWVCLRAAYIGGHAFLRTRIVELTCVVE